MGKIAWTPADLLQLSGGYWSACALHAAVRLDVFTPLAEKALTASELAGAVQADPRGLSMLLTALAAMNLLEKMGGSYAATPFATEFLSRTAPGYLGHIILHHHHLMESWAHLDEAVKSGRAIGGSVSHGSDEEVRGSFLMGMFNLAMQIAPRIATHVDLSRRRRMLDLGGDRAPIPSISVKGIPSSPLSYSTCRRHGASPKKPLPASVFQTASRFRRVILSAARSRGRSTLHGSLTFCMAKARRGAPSLLKKR